MNSGFWERKGKVKLYAENLKYRNNNQTELTVDEFMLVLKCITENFKSYDLIVELT